MKQKRIDFLIVLPLLGIISLGLISLSSALSYNQDKFMVQIGWVILSMMVFLFTSYKNKRFWENLSIPLFYANIILLLLVLAIGKAIGGAQRWLDLGFMNFQVSELTKLSTILFLAYRLNQKPTLQDGYRFRELLPEIGVMSIYMILIYKEPDLGTSLIIFMLSFAIIMSTKINKKSLLYLLIFTIISIPIAWEFVFQDYHKKRVIAMKNMIWPDSTDMSLTVQYHTKQSIIAVGSGELMGKGYKQGTQNILRFIPEHHTDFIFSVYAEEFGFMGIALLLLLYLLLFIRSLNVIYLVKEKFSALVIVGAVSLLWLQVSINIGMVIGILPVVGITLPFFSYGGSSLIINSILIGLIHNFSLTGRYN